MLLIPVFWPWEVWEVIPERMLMMMTMWGGVRSNKFFVGMTTVVLHEAITNTNMNNRIKNNIRPLGTSPST